MEAVRVVVWGRVQGVGFRAFVVREAARCGVTGHVRNRPDGSVEAHAHGARAALEDFVAALRQGPRAARVESTAEQWYDGAEAPGDFRVTG
jgi:acylphosphatase